MQVAETGKINDAPQIIIGKFNYLHYKYLEENSITCLSVYKKGRFSTLPVKGPDQKREFLRPLNFNELR